MTVKLIRPKLTFLGRPALSGHRTCMSSPTRRITKTDSLTRSGEARIRQYYTRSELDNTAAQGANLRSA